MGAMKTMGKEMSREEIEDLIRNVDEDGSGCIEFEEFLEMMVVHMNDQTEEEEIERMFECFDKNGDKYISQAELRLVFKKMGEEITDEEIDKIVKIADRDGDGRIGWDDFFAVMMDETTAQS